jgi:hypothetical protein
MQDLWVAPEISGFLLGEFRVDPLGWFYIEYIPIWVVPGSDLMSLQSLYLSLFIYFIFPFE